MRMHPGLAGACLFLVAAVAAAAPALTVTFVHPERYADASYSSFSGEKARAEVQRDIEQHLRRLAERLPPGDALSIDVLDIDLAGRFEPARAADVRIVRDIDWPRIKLHYVLSRDGRTVAEGEDRLADMSFLMAINRYPGDDRLRYEKAMLDAWFDRRFVPH